MWRFAIGVCLLLISSVIALYMVPPVFRVERHGLFGLGAQQYRKSWIFRQGIVSYALVTAANLLSDLWLWRAPSAVSALLFIGAVCFGLTAFFQPPPMLRRAGFDETAAFRHRRLFLAGIAFYAAAITLTLILHSTGLSIFFNLAILLMVILSLVQSRRQENTKGLFETLAFALCIIWPLLLYPAYF